MYLNQKGFTLVEVMIAGLILFSAVSIGTLVYRNSVRVVDQITVTTHISDALPNIMEAIKYEIYAKNRQGRGTHGNAIAYEWNLEAMKVSKNVVGSHHIITGGLEYGFFILVLNKVYLTVKYKRDGVTKEETFEYEELSWSK